MYNLYNLEPKQTFLDNYRRTSNVLQNKTLKAAEALTLILIFGASFLWLFV